MLTPAHMHIDTSSVLSSRLLGMNYQFSCAHQTSSDPLLRLGNDLESSGYVLGFSGLTDTQERSMIAGDTTTHLQYSRLEPFSDMIVDIDSKFPISLANMR